MSETETETPEEPTEPKHIEGDDQDAEEKEAEQQTPAEAAAAEGSDKISKELKAATAGYHTRVRNLLGMTEQEAEQLVCQKCNGFAFVIGAQSPLDELEWDELLEVCPTCKGNAALRTPSKDPNHMVRPCTACGAQGYRVKQAEVPNVVQFQPAQIAVPQVAPTQQYGYMGADGVFVPFANANSPGGV